LHCRVIEKRLSWCDQKETGLCDQKGNNEAAGSFFIESSQGGTESGPALAEDRALRGRNPSAV
jgi:hypothetical protein